MWGMERIGRRNILIFGAMWMAVCELIVAAIGSGDLQGSARVAGSKAQIAFVSFSTLLGDDEMNFELSLEGFTDFT